MPAVKSIHSVSELSQQLIETEEQNQRWHRIRLQEICRQLSNTCDQSCPVYITHEKTSQPGALYIPNECLGLPIELLAAIVAFSWGEAMHLSAESPTGEDCELFNFVAAFLARYNYPISRIVEYLFSQPCPVLSRQFPKISQQLCMFILANHKEQAL